MNVLITGASSGIGFQLALLFAEDAGTKVLALARSADKLGDLLEKKRELNLQGDIIIHPFDLRSRNETEVFSVCKEHGMDHVDILVNNAGYLIKKTFSTLGWDDWTAVYETNVIGLSRLTAALLPVLGGDTLSHIVNITSIGGVPVTAKFPGLAAYSSSKGAVAILTECMAVEFAPRKISVNALALGSVRTEMLEKAFPRYKAKNEPEDIAMYIKWFSINGHRFTNGKVIPLGGASV